MTRAPTTPDPDPAPRLVGGRRTFVRCLHGRKCRTGHRPCSTPLRWTADRGRPGQRRPTIRQPPARRAPRSAPRNASVGRIDDDLGRDRGQIAPVPALGLEALAEGRARRSRRRAGRRCRRRCRRRRAPRASARGRRRRCRGSAKNRSSASRQRGVAPLRARAVISRPSERPRRLVAELAPRRCRLTRPGPTAPARPRLAEAPAQDGDDASSRRRRPERHVAAFADDRRAGRPRPGAAPTRRGRCRGRRAPAARPRRRAPPPTGRTSSAPQVGSPWASAAKSLRTSSRSTPRRRCRSRIENLQARLVIATASPQHRRGDADRGGAGRRQARARARYCRRPRPAGVVGARIGVDSATPAPGAATQPKRACVPPMSADQAGMQARPPGRRHGLTPPCPSERQANGAVDDADHRVGLREVAPQLAAAGVQVLRQQADVVAAREQRFEDLARLRACGRCAPARRCARTSRR